MADKVLVDIGEAMMFKKPGVVFDKVIEVTVEGISLDGNSLIVKDKDGTIHKARPYQLFRTQSKEKET